MEKINELLKKVCTKEVMFYIGFGLLTTIVNWVLFYILNTKLNWNENVANFIAIVASVLVAYITNKDLVFHSEAKGLKENFIEFWKFIAGRTFTMILEWGAGALLFLTPIPKIISKVIITAVVVIINYFLSKFFAFSKKEV